MSLFREMKLDMGKSAETFMPHLVNIFKVAKEVGLNNASAAQ